MASRPSNRRWYLRDLPRAYVILACASIVIGGLSLLIDWSAGRHEAVGWPQANNSNQPHNASVEQRYTGSVILPGREGHCRETMFNNRTGRMMDGGDVNCYEAAHRNEETKKLSEPIEITRLRAVGKAFR